MKIRILKRLFGKNESAKNKERKRNEKAKKEQYEIMPNFREQFALLPNIIKAILIPEDTKPESGASVQEHAAAKSIAEKEAKTATSNEKVKDIYTRIQTTKNRNYEIIWLLQANEGAQYKSIDELIENYREVKDCESYRGMSVNYASNGKLYEISPLGEQDLAGLAKKLESGKNTPNEAH
ncbi:MAG: hypothetical protein Kow0099_38760 [Candidatus Abyssubacteria bacterium]